MSRDNSREAEIDESFSTTDTVLLQCAARLFHETHTQRSKPVHGSGSSVIDRTTALKLVRVVAAATDSSVEVGVNTRSGEIEIQIPVISTELQSEVRRTVTAVEHVASDAGIPVRIMHWDAIQVIQALTEWVERDVYDGWYEGDEWVSAAVDVREAKQYLQCDSTVVELTESLELNRDVNA